MTRSQLTTFTLATLAVAAAPAYLTWKAYTTMPKEAPHTFQAFPVAKTDEEWQASLTPKQYAVLRRHDTEYPGTSPLLDEHRDGTFACAGCGQPLFTADTKSRERERLAELLCGCRGRGGHERGLGARGASRGNPLQPVRRPPGPRVPRRPAADRAALLHQRRGAHVRTCRSDWRGQALGARGSWGIRNGHAARGEEQGGGKKSGPARERVLHRARSLSN